MYGEPFEIIPVEKLILSSRDVFTTTGLIQLRICTSIHTYLSVNIV